MYCYSKPGVEIRCGECQLPLKIALIQPPDFVLNSGEAWYPLFRNFWGTSASLNYFKYIFIFVVKNIFETRKPARPLSAAAPGRRRRRRLPGPPSRLADGPGHGPSHHDGPRAGHDDRDSGLAGPAAAAAGGPGPGTAGGPDPTGLNRGPEPPKPRRRRRWGLRLRILRPGSGPGPASG